MIDGVHAMIEAEKACVVEDVSPSAEPKATEESKTDPAVVAESAPV
jgi:hypothetical protein